MIKSRRDGWKVSKAACPQPSSRIKNPIRSQKVIPRQLTQRAPPKIIENPVRHLTSKLVNRKKLQIDRTSAAICMTRMRDPTPDIRGNCPTLHPTHAAKACSALSPSLYLPPGKTPISKPSADPAVVDRSIPSAPAGSVRPPPAELPSRPFLAAWNLSLHTHTILGRCCCKTVWLQGSHALARTQKISG